MIKITANKFKKEVEDNFDYIKDIFRVLHQHPELSFQEYETSHFIQQELQKMNIPFQSNIAGTGVLGRIEGVNPSKRVIALRADIDALPISEQTNLPYISLKQNMMHACGHDAHTACLLGAAKILSKYKNYFEGTILLIFQPGEEKAPGGANLMMKEGIFDDLCPDIIIGQHVSVDYYTGEMAFMTGKAMASADEIYITIKGKGGHGALPHVCNDTILAASSIVVALQQVASRLCPPSIPMVLTFGKMIADGATNIIPDEVNINGTFRTVDETWRSEAKKHIIHIINNTASSFGCTADVVIPEGYPCVINNDELTRKLTLFAEEYVGKESIKSMQLRMTSEDFGFFSQKYPSCFYRFGIKKKNNSNSSGLHTSTFQVDEDSLKTGVGGLAWIAFNLLI